MPKIKVLPHDIEIEVNHGDNLRTSLISSELNIKSPCGGCASCGQCIVIIKDNYASLSDISFEEKQLLGNVFHITQERLSCQTNILGDVTVDVSNHVPLETKSTSKTVRRSREEADKVVEDRRAKAKEKPQRQGGFKKPKAFKS